MPRTYIKLSDWVAEKSKSTKRGNDEKRESQRKKFATCRICGGQMKYLSGTNLFICENEVEKDGVKTTCNNINMVDAQYQDYMRYLFD